mgnify:CR=1 FL=1
MADIRLALSPRSGLKALIAKGKEQNYLTYAEVNDHLTESISDPDQVEDIIQMINDMGIKVYETAPDADTLLMNEGDSNTDNHVLHGKDSSPSRHGCTPRACCAFGQDECPE